MMYQYGYATQLPWFHPEGYRFVKHILLPVDAELLAAYTDLQTRYAEQTDTDAAATENTEDVTAATAVVTAEDVEAAKVAIIASVQAQLDEINAKLAEGVSFEDLLVAYGTDPGMTSGSYPDGYEVSQSSYGFVPEFVEAAFSVDQIGDISEPYVSQYGVHLVQYAGDVPAGPVELTDDLKTQIHDTLESEQCDAVLSNWHDSADIQYTGILRSIEQIQADETQPATAE